MYVPQHFKEADRGKLFDLIESHSFGLLISDAAGDPFASHLPFLVDRTCPPHGCLVGHMARANPQWGDADGKTVLAVFSGPHAYVSPTWYRAEDVVPTWNYVAVHAYGTFRAVHEPDALREILRASVATFEASMPTPWTFDPESEFSEKMAKAVVGFRVEISRIEGKWKLGQNHPKERRENVSRELRASPHEDARRIAELVARLPP